MKFELFSRLGEWTKSHKKTSVALALVLFAGLCAGAWRGWKEYQYRQTSQYAFQRIVQALTPPDPHELANLVDFNGIGADLADAAQKSFPFFMAGPDQERKLRHAVQTGLLKRFLDDGKGPSKNSKKPETEEERLHAPFVLLPDDFTEQLRNQLNLQEKDDRTAFVSAQLENPLLKRNFTVVLRMDRTANGWKLAHVANAKEITDQLREGMLERHSKLRHIYEERNAGTAKKMNQLLPIQSCSAHAGLLSDRKTLLMVVQVIARNIGRHQVNNFNVDVTLTGRNGNKILQRYLNAAKPAAPGEDFNHRWTFELDASDPLAQSILKAGPLECKASWQTLGVDNGEVLHMAEVPNPDVQCAIAGHDHPQGFCALPFFQK